MSTYYKAEIKKLKAEIKKLKDLAIKDQLTGVLNRRGIDEEFKVLFDEAYYFKNNPDSKRRFRLEDLSLLLIDCDNFKKINDNHGHDIGDVVLKKIANVLKAKTRNIDLVGRLGGEEFVIALFGLDESGACEKAESLRKSFRDIKINEHNNIKITASFGVASVRRSSPKTLKEFVVFADEAMYEAKTNRGKDCVVKYSDMEPVYKKEEVPSNNTYVAKLNTGVVKLLTKLVMIIIISRFSMSLAIAIVIFEVTFSIYKRFKDKFDSLIAETVGLR